MLNATFNTITILLVEETGLPEVNHQPVTFFISALVSSLDYRIGLIWESRDDTRADIEKAMV